MANAAAQSNSPRKTAWKRYIFNCGYPITATKLSLVSFLLTIVAKKLIFIDLLADYTYLVTWAAIAVSVYVADIVLRWLCMTSDWYSENPINDWKYRPRTAQGYLSSLLGLLLLVVAAFAITSYYDFEFKACNYLPEVFPFTLYCKSGEVGVPYNNDEAMSAITKRLLRNDETTSTNKRELELLSLQLTILRQDLAKLLGESDVGPIPNKGLGNQTQGECPTCDQGGNKVTSDVVEPIMNPNQKCWDTYPSLYPVTCNASLPCMHGKHPITGITQQDCIMAP
jgi:hypothetical protein